jgi:hypothetical protein
VIFVDFVVFVPERLPSARDVALGTVYNHPCCLYQVSVRRMPSRRDTDGA